MVCISGSNIFKEIKKRNVLIILKNFLYCKIDKLIDQTALCLGNIIVESTEFRDISLKIGVLDKVVNISKDISKPVELIKNCMFLISNMLRGKPKPEIEKVRIIYND
jgi:hypothetical protein